MQLEEKAVKDRSYGERIAEVATRAAGSTPSVLLHTLFFAAWVVLNIGVVPAIPVFDPLPFNFLTMLVSIEVIFLTLLVLLTQQRIIREADKRAHLDLQLSMLAEQEGTIVLRMLQRITQHLGMKDEADLEARELQERTNVSQLARVPAGRDERLVGPGSGAYADRQRGLPKKLAIVMSSPRRWHEFAQLQLFA